TSSTSNPNTQADGTVVNVPPLSPTTGEQAGAPGEKGAAPAEEEKPPSSSKQSPSRQDKPPAQKKKKKKPSKRKPAKKAEPDTELLTTEGNALVLPSRDLPVSVEQL